MAAADPAPRKGLSEREYARHAGLSRGAVQKARSSGRLVLHPDGSIDAAASDARRRQATDPAKQRSHRSRRRGTATSRCRRRRSVRSPRRSRSRA